MADDAIVIGGGVMGLASARELRRRGYRVRLLERAQPGRAASWASAGIIGATLRYESDPRYALRQVSAQLWPEFASAIQEESGLDPEYLEIGCIQLAETEAELGWLQQAAQRTDGAEFLDAPRLRKLEPGISQHVRGGLLVAATPPPPPAACFVHGDFGPANLLWRVGQMVVLDFDKCTRGDPAADLVVLAAGAWSGSIGNVEPRPPVAPQRGQILALDQAAVGIQHVLLTSEDPYFVPRADARLVVGATREEAGWDPSLTAGGVAWLLKRAIDVVPALEHSPIVELWTGFRPVSADGLPLIGRGALDGLYFLTGHGPSGIAPLPGSIALLMALIANEPPPVAPEPFDPLRFTS